MTDVDSNATLSRDIHMEKIQCNHVSAEGEKHSRLIDTRRQIGAGSALARRTRPYFVPSENRTQVLVTHALTGTRLPFAPPGAKLGSRIEDNQIHNPMEVQGKGKIL